VCKTRPFDAGDLGSIPNWDCGQIWLRRRAYDAEILSSNLNLPTFLFALSTTQITQDTRVKCSSPVLILHIHHHHPNTLLHNYSTTHVI
jgi:hypothetical protein